VAGRGPRIDRQLHRRGGASLGPVQPLVRGRAIDARSRDRDHEDARARERAPADDGGRARADDAGGGAGHGGEPGRVRRDLEVEVDEAVHEQRDDAGQQPRPEQAALAVAAIAHAPADADHEDRRRGADQQPAQEAGLREQLEDVAVRVLDPAADRGGLRRRRQVPVGPEAGAEPGEREQEAQPSEPDVGARALRAELVRRPEEARDQGLGREQQHAERDRDDRPDLPRPRAAREPEQRDEPRAQRHEAAARLGRDDPEQAGRQAPEHPGLPRGPDVPLAA
jgi:hypothetical protein